MTIWVVGYCKREGCGWATASIKEGRFTKLDVTKAMVEHSEETGHSCRTKQHYR